MLMQYRFDKVVWLLKQVQAVLPLFYGQDLVVIGDDIDLIEERLVALVTDKHLWYKKTRRP
jgi:hypothetical protein